MRLVKPRTSENMNQAVQKVACSPHPCRRASHRHPAGQTHTRGDPGAPRAGCGGRAEEREWRRSHRPAEQKAKEERPFGRADRHVIEAWMEIENEDRAELLARGTNPGVVQKLLFDKRSEWVQQTDQAYEAAHKEQT